MRGARGQAVPRTIATPTATAAVSGASARQLPRASREPTSWRRRAVGRSDANSECVRRRRTSENRRLEWSAEFRAGRGRLRGRSTTLLSGEVPTPLVGEVKPQVTTAIERPRPAALRAEGGRLRNRAWRRIRRHMQGQESDRDQKRHPESSHPDSEGSLLTQFRRHAGKAYRAWELTSAVLVSRTAAWRGSQRAPSP